MLVPGNGLVGMDNEFLCTLQIMYNRRRTRKLIINNANTTVAMPFPVNTKRRQLQQYVQCKSINEE